MSTVYQVPPITSTEGLEFCYYVPPLPLVGTVMVGNPTGQPIYVQVRVANSGDNTILPWNKLPMLALDPWADMELRRALESIFSPEKLSLPRYSGLWLTASLSNETPNIVPLAVTVSG